MIYHTLPLCDFIIPDEGQQKSQPHCGAGFNFLLLNGSSFANAAVPLGIHTHSHFSNSSDSRKISGAILLRCFCSTRL